MSTLTATLEILKSGDFHARWDAAKMLSSFGEQAIAPLTQLLHGTDSDLELQWVVARALGDFQHPDALMALATLLCNTQDDEISEIAAEALGKMGATAIPVLEEYLNHHPMPLSAVQALAHIHDVQTLPLLAQASQNEQSEVRAAALEALSIFHQPQVLSHLLQGLNDSDATVRQIAVTGLGYRSQAQSNLVPHIQPLLLDQSLPVRQQAALALGRLGATQPLLEHLKTTDCLLPLKRTIIQVLGQVGNFRALQHLQQAFQLSIKANSFDLARAVVDAIATFQTHQPYATQILLEILEQSQPQPPTLLNAISTALGQLSQPEAMEPLIQLLAQPDMGVRLHAIAALKHLNTRLVHERLKALAKDRTLRQEFAAGIAVALQEW